MITIPTTGIFKSLSVDVVAGPVEEVDYVHANLLFSGDELTLLTDTDVDDMIQIIVGRLTDAHPDYQIDAYRTWTGTNSSGRTTVYTPPS